MSKSKYIKHSAQWNKHRNKQQAKELNKKIRQADKKQIKTDFLDEVRNKKN